MNVRVPDDPHARLRARLRAGDPLETGEDDAALARIESRLDAAAAASSANGSRAAGFGWRLAAPAFGLLTIVAVAWLGVRFASAPRAAAPERAPGSERAVVATNESAVAPSTTTSVEAVPPGDGETRQIQFETPGGTRVIWVLDPRFTL